MADQAKAERVVDAVFASGATDQDGKRPNAFKHAFWTGLMVGTFGRHNEDTERAWLMAEAHEYAQARTPCGRWTATTTEWVGTIVNLKSFRTSSGDPRYGTDREICRLLRGYAKNARFQPNPRRFEILRLHFIERGGLPMSDDSQSCAAAARG